MPKNTQPLKIHFVGSIKSNFNLNYNFSQYKSKIRKECLKN